MVIIFEFFLLAILARVAFTRTDDLILIRKHNNVPIEESDEGLTALLLFHTFCFRRGPCCFYKQSKLLRQSSFSTCYDIGMSRSWKFTNISAL